MNGFRQLSAFFLTACVIVSSCGGNSGGGGTAEAGKQGKRRDLYFLVSAMGANSYFYDHKA
ncbi:MAG: hypothetical protein J7M24_01840, partial [Candidatus Latescibacteria bacterium]|nr:hypothetical protein [Candidatus Latescibacterota bacterium]